MTNMKHCFSCKTIKTTQEFHKNKTRKGGRDTYCKNCTLERKRAWVRNNLAQYRATNKRYGKKYRAENKEKRKKCFKEWREKNLLSRLYKVRQWKRENKEQINSQQRKKYREDIQYKLGRVLRNRMYCALRNNQRAGSAVRDLGCSIKFFQEYIGARFEEGMTWNNWGKGYGKWSIDHIKAVSNFDLADREQFLEAAHYTNMQPMWFIENIKKSNKQAGTAVDYS